MSNTIEISQIIKNLPKELAIIMLNMGFKTVNDFSIPYKELSVFLGPYDAKKVVDVIAKLSNTTITPQRCTSYFEVKEYLKTEDFETSSQLFPNLNKVDQIRILAYAVHNRFAEFYESFLDQLSFKEVTKILKKDNMSMPVITIRPPTIKLSQRDYEDKFNRYCQLDADTDLMFLINENPEFPFPKNFANILINSEALKITKNMLIINKLTLPDFFHQAKYKECVQKVIMENATESQRRILLDYINMEKSLMAPKFNYNEIIGFLSSNNSGKISLPYRNNNNSNN